MFVCVLKSCPLLMAAVSLCLAADISKPACNAHNQGRMWPEAANGNPKLLKKFSQCGELQICSRPGLRYRWESLTVRVDQLGRGKKKQAPPAGCEVPPAEEIADAPQPATR